MTPLYIPLSHLPAPVPMWTPGFLDWRSGCAIMQTFNGGGSYRTCPDDEYIQYTDGVKSYDASRLSVDLTPPPLDANGHPTRIDALPVLVDMLARAMGHPEGQRTLRPSLVCDEWVLRTWTSGGVYHSTRFTLASIPLTTPNAHRLALVALFTARVWENV